MQFDLPALQRLYGLDDKALIEAGKVHDTLILSRLAAGGDTNLGYGLDAVAERCGVDGKLLRDGDSALKVLAKQYGGFDKIPLDNAEYIAYALQDVRANVAVYNQMLPAALEAVSAEYLRREHEKMHVLSVVEAHGIRVNTAKVEEFWQKKQPSRLRSAHGSGTRLVSLIRGNSPGRPTAASRLSRTI